jgi:endonuclease/exonuclease/phosphatase family metal-dependent hydrolase
MIKLFLLIPKYLIMKICPFISFLWLALSMNTVSAQSAEEILMLSFNSDEMNNSYKNYSIVGLDSTVSGINGKAKYFTDNSYVSFEINEEQSQLWSNQNFSVEIWVQTKKDNQQFEVIASNKDWNSGEIKVFTSIHEFGYSRNSGENKGWAIVCQPDGSWAWNIGDGKYRLDYRPTAPRQKINDNQWHQIVFTINRELEEARMYFDGRNVAIYNIAGLSDFDSYLPVCLANDALATKSNSSYKGALDEFNVYDYVLNAKDVAEKYQDFVPAAKINLSNRNKVKELNLMAWNILHGGRNSGREIGPKQVIDFIRDTGTDIVMMQETYGSGALIADALGYYFYLASSNISVISKYPIIETKLVFQSFRCGLTKIELSPGQYINLASLWIYYLPAWESDVNAEDATEEKLIAAEGKTRHKEIKEILKRLENERRNTDTIPFVIGGDFNSPSHLDWNQQTRPWHRDLKVNWPVSIEMTKHGFTDSFREINTDLNYASPTMTAERISYRIDFIYYKGKNLKASHSDIHFKYKGIWPSDHPAVTTTLQINN